MLEAERLHLAGQVAGLEQGGGMGPDFDDNFADSGQVAAEQGENKVLAGQLRAELDSRGAVSCESTSRCNVEWVLARKTVWLSAKAAGTRGAFSARTLFSIFMASRMQIA